MAPVAPMGIDDSGAVKPTRQKPATGRAPKPPKPAKKRVGTKKR